MKIAENTKRVNPLYFTFLFLFVLTFSVSNTFAQSNAKANITGDEFTAKGEDTGWQEGTMVENLKFNDINNKKFKLHDLLDKPVLLEFWSVKSAQAKRNKTVMKSFYKRFNINIVGICTDEYPNQIRKIGQEQQLQWSNVMDDSKKYNGQTFAESRNIADAKYVIINPDKTIHKIFYSDRDIGKVGVTLQNYFK